MRIKIYGHSDDCIEVEASGPGHGRLLRDELTAVTGSGAVDVTTLRVATIGGSRAVRVHAVYDGCWAFAVGKDGDADNAQSLPPWKVEILDEHGYSTALVVDTGDDIVTVTVTDGAR